MVLLQSKELEVVLQNIPLTGDLVVGVVLEAHLEQEAVHIHRKEVLNEQVAVHIHQKEALEAHLLPSVYQEAVHIHQKEVQVVEGPAHTVAVVTALEDLAWRMVPAVGHRQQEEVVLPLVADQQAEEAYRQAHAAVSLGHVHLPGALVLRGQHSGSVRNS